MPWIGPSRPSCPVWTLMPGDIIATGTPSGVGMGKKPEPIWLKAGDMVELGIDGLGSSGRMSFRIADRNEAHVAAERRHTHTLDDRQKCNQ